jgi:hypothetical protein
LAGKALGRNCRLQRQGGYKNILAGRALWLPWTEKIFDREILEMGETLLSANDANYAKRKSTRTRRIQYDLRSVFF